MNEPLSPGAATALIKAILQKGQIAWSQHALDELAKDSMATVDAVNVMRAGKVHMPAELHRNDWRYRIETSLMAVIVAFESEEELQVITAWRAKKK
jgi:hypothetical protein